MQTLASKSFLGSSVQAKPFARSSARKHVAVRAAAEPVTKLNTKRSEQVCPASHVSLQLLSGFSLKAFTDTYTYDLYRVSASWCVIVEAA